MPGCTTANWPDCRAAQNGADLFFLQLLLGTPGQVSDYRQFIEDTVKPAIEVVPGVARVSASQGRGRGEQILEILFDPSRAAQLGIDLPQTAARLGQANDVSGGFVEVGRRQYALRFTGRYEPRELSEFVLDWRDGRPVKLGDLLLRLVDTQSPEISVNAPLRAARFNPPGSSVQVEAEGQRQTARIRAVVPVGTACPG